MQYELFVETQPEQPLVTFRLLNEAGDYKGSHEIAVTPERAADWEGIFDTRRHVERYEEQQQREGADKPETADQILTRLGVFLGQEVLGADIMRELTASPQRRTLLVKLPPTGADPLAAAFARVPYEIARLAPDKPSLMERNLAVRIEMADTAQTDAAVREAAEKVAAGETLRVLLVFAEAPGSRPLGMRQERQELLNLFYREILPKTRAQIDVLCHGVTRAALTEQITAAQGYHIVHWSGHGHLNLLELRGADGQQELISGEALAQLFADAGGFMPQIVFLSACLSGAFVDIRSWADFQAAMLGRRTDGKQTPLPILPDILDNPAGYTGAALALLRIGIPQVIAMRYEVGDMYARRLACEFYKRLLADPGAEQGNRTTDDALALARADLLKAPNAAQFGAINHATPIMFGQAGRRLHPVSKRSKQLEKARPQPQPLLPGGSHELDAPRDFIGRGAQLTPLNLRWRGAGAPAGALIQGMAGMGKTALAAEAIHLWFSRFDYVFAFQAKPTELTLDEFYRQLDAKLTLCSQAYLDKCEATPSARVFLETSPQWKGDARYDKMRQNLIEALRDKAILLVLDNFETNLAAAQAQGCPCKDPRWDALLRELCRELPDTRSRLLLTSRLMPAALRTQQTSEVCETSEVFSEVLWLRLGPLPKAELGLYITSHPKLAALFFADDDGRGLARRLLDISRGHPLIMNRLAAFADQREKLRDTLNALAQTGWERLPELFAAAKSARERDAERQYLEDAAIGSIDLLIARLTPAARRLLWTLTQANEPFDDDQIECVWLDKTVSKKQEEKILAKIPSQLKKFLQSSDDAEKKSLIPSLLSELLISGLITQYLESNELTKESSMRYTFHDLVQERIAVWMQGHTIEQGGKTKEQIWITYGKHYAALSNQLRTSGKENAMPYSIEAGKQALTYFVQAKSFDRLGDLTSGIVNYTHDAAFLRGVMTELLSIADIVPSGKERWAFRRNLADALDNLGYSEQSLILYEQAATEANDVQQWAHVAWICFNWANALVQAEQLDKAKAMRLRVAEAQQKAKSPKIDIIGNELEMLRIDVMQERINAVLPEIEMRVNNVRNWWQQSRSGEVVFEATDTILLRRTLSTGLDILREANLRLKRWAICLNLLDEQEQIERELGESKYALCCIRFNRYDPLCRLGKWDDAQRIVEECFDIYKEANNYSGQMKALGALAVIWDKRGDLLQALAIARKTLSLCNQLSNLSDRVKLHGNYMIYLGKAQRFDEASQHLLVALIYCLFIKRHDLLSDTLQKLATLINTSAKFGNRYELPQVAAVLNLPEFEALARFVAQRGVDIQELQAAIDELVEHARQAAA